MTSARKLTANRNNARKSTGPKSAAGKWRASKNARQHGLSVPVIADPNWSGEITAIAQAIAGEQAVPISLETAKQIAAAQLDVLRVRRARQQLISHALADDSFEPKQQTLLRERILRDQAHLPRNTVKRLMAELGRRPRGTNKQALVVSELSAQLAKLDRYERRALSRRRRAIRLFDSAQRVLAAGRLPRRYVIDLQDLGREDA